MIISTFYGKILIYYIDERSVRMSELSSVKPQMVFKYFSEISAIPRGSENMEGIADYCIDFASKHSLKAVRDSANNVIIYKPATVGFENSEPIILQGHLDMVCQKEQSSSIDFANDGLDIYIDGDFVKARGTTLGADNGIAVSMILSVLESDDISHPAIEAVFTTDEEIGMIGASKLDMSLLTAKRMINLDAEEDDTLTVSCAGGADFKAFISLNRKEKSGTGVKIVFKNLLGGHSGVEIDKGRVNANILMGRFLNHMQNRTAFDLISINGGDKGNAIPNHAELQICTNQPQTFINEAQEYINIIKNEMIHREPNFDAEISVLEETEYSVLAEDIKQKLINILLLVPDGVQQMSAEIKGLVETSLNLGVLKTENTEALMHFTLRSNKKSALVYIEDKLRAFFYAMPCKIEVSGYYPAWEFKSNSKLQRIYKNCFLVQYGFAPKVEAIHAGLECGMFSAAIDELDCIAMGPQLYDVHTVNEKLSISSTKSTYILLTKILENCK